MTEERTEKARPHVVFVNAVFPPQPGATGMLVAELADALTDKGWEVRVTAGGAGLSGLVRDGIEVERVAGAPRRESLWRRVVGTGPLWARLIHAASQARDADVIVLGADPPLLFLAAPWVRRQTGAVVVHWAQDLYPDVASALGIRVAGARLVRQLAARALRQCDAVVAIGRQMAQRLVAAGVPPGRVEVIPNWAPPLPEPDAQAFRRANGLGDRFVVMYSGTLGLAHPYRPLLDAAAELADTDPDVAVVIVGQGARVSAARAEAQQRQVPVMFCSPVPAPDLGSSLSAADLHVVTMEESLEGMLVPSKVYGALASGRPVLFLGPDKGEAARIVLEAEAGAVLPRATGPEIAQAIRAWKADGDERARAGARGQAAVAGGLEAATQAFHQLFSRLASQGPAAEPPGAPVVPSS